VFDPQKGIAFSEEGDTSKFVQYSNFNGSYYDSNQKKTMFKKQDIISLENAAHDFF
jgi:hypothetical protein